MQPDGNNATDVNSVRQVSRTPIPSRADAVEFNWSPAIARSRGIYGFDSLDLRARSFNLIRAQVSSLRRERNWRLLAFVSATPSVGKSYVSANTAAALSRDPRICTHLVDLDLRRGGTASIFGLPLETGLETYLSAHHSEAPPAYVPLGENLILIPTVPGPVNSAELLASERMAAMFQAMRHSPADNLYLFDLPPVFANDDSLSAMESMDGYVIIAEEGKTTQREIESIVNLLGTEQLAGVVLNKYRGGLISEGRGAEDYYAAGY